MILLRLWNFIRGYVIINVNGYFIEKFINLCANNNIYLWNIRRKTHNNITLKISIKGFKQLKNITKRTRCKVKILKKSGLPFIKHKYKKRKTFLMGFITFIIIIYVLSSFIWVIEIKGTENTNPQQIINFLDKNGIKPGIIKFAIDKKAIVSRMIIEVEDLSWADLKLVGTKVILEVVERVRKPPVIDKSKPCNIYSVKDGVIKNVITKQGIAKVEKGDVVTKGKLLISGIIENRWHPEEVRLVHSEGEVYATTWYQQSQNINLIQIKREKTNESKVGFGLKIFNKNYSIFRKHSPYKLYDKQDKTVRLAFWKNFELPVELVITKYYNAKYNKYILNEQEAKKELKKELFNKLDKIIAKDVKIVDKKIEYNNLGNNIIRGVATYECVEDIGQKKIIANEY